MGVGRLFSEVVTTTLSGGATEGSELPVTAVVGPSPWPGEGFSRDTEGMKS